MRGSEDSVLVQYSAVVVEVRWWLHSQDNKEGGDISTMAPLHLVLLFLINIAPLAMALPSVSDYDYPHDAEYEYDDDSEHSDEEYSQPSVAGVTIQSEKVHEVVQEENVIRLPCRVHNPGEATCFGA